MTRRRQPTETSARRRRPRSRVNYKAIAGYTLTTILVALLTYFALVSPMFYVKRVLVTGAKTVGNAAIVRAMDLSSTQNILLVAKRRIVARLLQNPVLKDAVIYRRLPGTVSVRITERDTDVVLDSGGKLYDVDDAGIPFRTSAVADPGCTAIACSVKERVVLGKPLKDDAFLSARSSLLLSRQHGGIPVTRITVDPSGELCLNVKDGFPIKLGRPERLPLKIKIIAKMLDEIPDVVQDGEYIDISCPEAPVYKPKK